MNKKIFIVCLLLVFFILTNSVTFSDAYISFDGQSMGEYPISCVGNGLSLSSELEQTETKHNSLNKAKLTIYSTGNFDSIKLTVSCNDTIKLNSDIVLNFDGKNQIKWVSA